jgi:hypothetical protein
MTFYNIKDTEGREESNEEVYEMLQVLDKVNKNDYTILIGNMNALVENNKITNIVGTNGEASSYKNDKNR